MNRFLDDNVVAIPRKPPSLPRQHSGLVSEWPNLNRGLAEAWMKKVKAIPRRNVK